MHYVRSTKHYERYTMYDADIYTMLLVCSEILVDILCNTTHESISKTMGINSISWG